MAWSLGKRVKMARIERGISQRQLAQHTGLRQSHLSLVENDKHDPSATLVRTVALALDVSTDYLLGLSDAMQAPKGAASTPQRPTQRQRPRKPARAS